MVKRRVMGRTGQIVLWLFILSCALSLAMAEERAPGDERLIRQTLDSYVSAFNKNDPASLSNLWAEEAQYEDETGEVYKGRKQIREAFKQFFAENKGISLKISVSKVDINAPTEAIVVGTSVVSLPGEEGSEAGFAAQMVKKIDKWLLAGVGETADSSSYEHLKDLEWLIGEWVDEKSADIADIVSDWTGDKNFIQIGYAIDTDEVGVEGTLIIGWDPVGKKLKSWIFDSNVGVAEGVWSRAGSKWTVKISRALGASEMATQTDVYERVNNNTFIWSSIDRTENGKKLPDVKGVKIVRKQPKNK